MVWLTLTQALRSAIQPGSLTYRVDNSFNRVPICLGERCCLPWSTENLAGLQPMRALASTSLLQGIWVRCVLLSEVFLDQLPWFKLFRGYKKTTGQCLRQPENDGMIWKQSSQYFGLMSIYLRGVCSSLPFYLSKHIWCPVVEASKRSVCFPVDACSLFIQLAALAWLWAVWEKQTSRLAPRNVTMHWQSFQVHGFWPQWQSDWHESNKKHLNSPKSTAATPHPPFRPSDSSWV